MLDSKFQNCHTQDGTAQNHTQGGTIAELRLSLLHAIGRRFCSKEKRWR